MPHGLWNLGRICRIDCGSLLYATWIAEFRRRASHVENLITVPLQPPRHNVPHPIPKHTDKSQHRTPHHNPRTQNNLGTTFHIQHRSIQTKVNTVPHTTIQELLKKARGVCRGARPCAPLRFSHISMWISPLRGAAAYAVIRPEFRNPYGIYGRDSAIHAGIRPGPPQPMRLLFPHTKFRKYLINKVFPK